MDPFREVDAGSYTATDMPKYPARTLIAHCQLKGLQVGSVLGLILTPAYSFIKKQPVSTAFLRAMPAATAAGLVVVTSLLWLNDYQGKLDAAGVDDRAYRISKNIKQTKVDQFSFLGGLMGASLGVILFRGSLSFALAHGCSGVALGMLSYVIDEKVHIKEMIKSITKTIQEDRKSRQYIICSYRRNSNKIIYNIKACTAK